MKWPESFSFRIANQLGSETDAFFRALDHAAPVSIRINKVKSAEIKGDPIPWCSSGRYLKERPVFTLDPAFHQGRYYVQEASSMFLEEVVRQTVPDRPLRVLDLCAAPGGKSTHMLDLLHPDSLLVCNEVIRTRIPILTQNLVRWGRSNVAVTSSDPEAFSSLTGFFDVILVDAPCSGEGMFRKDPDAASEWSETHVQLCAARQARILDAVWPALRTDGLLIYSTCTWNREEDESNLCAFAERSQAESIRLTTDQFPGIQEVSSGHTWGYKFFPHRLHGEGFFIGILRKTSAEEEIRMRKNRERRNGKHQDISASLLTDPQRFTIREEEQNMFADRTAHAEALDTLRHYLALIRSGIRLGEWKGSKLIPDHDLALSTDLSPEAYPVADLDEHQALKFLRKEGVDFPGSGQTLVRYQGFGLGWANVLPGRVNNQLPTTWRIRMS